MDQYQYQTIEEHLKSINISLRKLIQLKELEQRNKKEK